MMRSSCDGMRPKIFRAGGSGPSSSGCASTAAAPDQTRCAQGLQEPPRIVSRRASWLCGFGPRPSVLHGTAPWHASQHCMAASCLVVRQPAQAPLANVSPHPLLSDAAPRMSCAQPCVAPWTGHSSCLTTLPKSLSASRTVPRLARRCAAPLHIVFFVHTGICPPGTQATSTKLDAHRMLPRQWRCYLSRGANPCVLPAHFQHCAVTSWNTKYVHWKVSALESNKVSLYSLRIHPPRQEARCITALHWWLTGLADCTPETPFWPMNDLGSCRRRVEIGRVSQQTL